MNEMINYPSLEVCYQQKKLPLNRERHVRAGVTFVKTFYM